MRKHSRNSKPLEKPTLTDAQKKQKILFNLFDTTPETQVIISWCERHCATFADVIAHLTDTLICVSHYNGRHAIHQAKQAQRQTSVMDFPEDRDDFRTLLQAIRNQQQLPDDLKIPSKAWNLLPKEAWDVFIQEHTKLLPNSESNPTSPPSNPMPKQYGGVSQSHHANAAHIEIMNLIEAMMIQTLSVMMKLRKLPGNLPMSYIATRPLIKLHTSLECLLLFLTLYPITLSVLVWTPAK